MPCPLTTLAKAHPRLQIPSESAFFLFQKVPHARRSRQHKMATASTPTRSRRPSRKQTQPPTTSPTAAHLRHSTRWYGLHSLTPCTCTLRVKRATRLRSPLSRAKSQPYAILFPSPLNYLRRSFEWRLLQKSTPSVRHTTHATPLLLPRRVHPLSL